MPKIDRRSFLLASTASAAVAASVKPAAAQTVNKDPNLLKTTLTPFGAERAGNADGSIPAWTGGYTTVPAGYVSGQPRPDPFADEKPILSITAANMAQYKDKLAVGLQELLTRFPSTFRVDVYPSHRTHAMPQFVYDNTALNVTRAQISADGSAVTGAYAGPPFPIPSSGAEVMWNHLTAFQAVSLEAMNGNWVVPNGGAKYLASQATVTANLPYYDPDSSPDDFKGVYKEYIVNPVAPAYQIGNALMSIEFLNVKEHPPKTMQYLPGQRRVRQAPDLAYDNPNFLIGGVTNFDETFIYNGRMDQYDFKLIGKKEMYIPANNNKCFLSTYDEQLGANHYNPDVLRWELRRVWVVEMTLLPGARNVDQRRTMYVDEDTWGAAMADVYDSGGSFWKFFHTISILAYELPSTLATGTNIAYDLHKGNYAYNVGCDSSVTDQQYKLSLKPLAPSYFTPSTLISLQGGS
jgi:hypothetical protein